MNNLGKIKTLLLTAITTIAVSIALIPNTLDSMAMDGVWAKLIQTSPNFIVISNAPMRVVLPDNTVYDFPTGTLFETCPGTPLPSGNNGYMESDAVARVVTVNPCSSIFGGGFED